MLHLDSVEQGIAHIKPAISSARDNDRPPDSDFGADVESDADEHADIDDWPPDELDLEIDDEPDPEPGDFWLDDDDEDD